MKDFMERLKDHADSTVARLARNKGPQQADKDHSIEELKSIKLEKLELLKVL